MEPEIKALTDYDIEALAGRFEQWGEKPSHARRLLGHFYRHAGIMDHDALRVPQSLRRRVAEHIPLRQSHVSTETRAADGTVKLLIAFERGGAVEAVLIPSRRPDRAAGCVSCQIGCAMGCDFCATARDGLVRNLSAGEMVEQFVHLRERALAGGRTLQTVVFMGMGEPMHNLDNVVGAIRIIGHPEVGGVGWRNLTVSTVGIVPGMRRFTDMDLNVNLTLSLHAPDDQTRARIVPAARRYAVADIIAEARRFLARARLFPNIAYCMLKDVNDSDEHAGRLADLMEGFRAHVNLIPYNQIGAGVSGTIYEPSPPERIAAFLRVLRARHVAVHARESRGHDANAACGQLRAGVGRADCALRDAARRPLLA